MTVADWSILEDDRIANVIEKAAEAVARDWSGYVELEDLIQEGRLSVATKENGYGDLLSLNSMGLIYYRLWCDLVDVARKQASATSLNLSYEAIVEGDSDDVHG